VQETLEFTQREKDEGSGQDQDGVYRQQAEALHHLLKEEDRYHEESVRAFHPHRYKIAEFN